jgi:hypothetical protein
LFAEANGQFEIVHCEHLAMRVHNLVAQKRDTPKQEATVTSSSGCRVALQQWSVSEINSLGEDRYDGNSG